MKELTTEGDGHGKRSSFSYVVINFRFQKSIHSSAQSILIKFIAPVLKK